MQHKAKQMPALTLGLHIYSVGFAYIQAKLCPSRLISSCDEGAEYVYDMNFILALVAGQPSQLLKDHGFHTNENTHKKNIQFS